MPEPIVPALRAGRALANACLHPLRRRRALGTLERLPADAGILVLCWGNICRSPFAAELLERASEQTRDGRWGVSSAGFLESNRASPDVAVEVAREWDVDLSSHRSVTVSEPLVHDSDLILVMDDRQRRRLHRNFTGVTAPVIIMSDLEPSAVPPRGIPDPVEQPREVFREVYGRIHSVVEMIASQGR